MLVLYNIPDIRLAPGLIVVWWRQREGIAAIEAAFIFPVLLSLLMGLWDLGNGLIINQKVITASQMTADLLAREETAGSQDRNEAIKAAEMALHPYDGATIAYDIASVRFDSDGDPNVQPPRVTHNMSANDQAVNTTQGLGNEGQGVVVVTIQYDYEPLFSEFIAGTFTFEEVAYARGRKNSYVEFTN